MLNGTVAARLKSAAAAPGSSAALRRWVGPGPAALSGDSFAAAVYSDQWHRPLGTAAADRHGGSSVGAELRPAFIKVFAPWCGPRQSVDAALSARTARG